MQKEITKITFQEEGNEEEKQKLILTLKKDGFILITTAETEGQEKYKEGEKYQTSWGDILLARKIEYFKDINEHPLIKDLSQEQVILFSQYNYFSVVRFEKA